MEDSATLALIIQFVARCIASLLVLRQMAGVLATVMIGMCGTTIVGVLLPQWLIGLQNNYLHLIITSVIGTLIAAWLMRLIILHRIRRDP